MFRFAKAVVLVLGALAAGSGTAIAAGPPYDLSPEGNARFLAEYAARPDVHTLPGGLMYRVMRAGTGTSPINKKDVATVLYLGQLINGNIFDRTKPGVPTTFVVGNLIQGWTEALMKMKTGDEWELVIPAALAYGDDGVGKLVPPGQTLVFIVELTKVEYAP
jgi:FKBP-type peptidyl-prolyl cis-trans isomerase FklB